MSKNISRRSFLKGAAFGAGALALPQFAIGTPGRSVNEKLNIAFIGVGGRADPHIKYARFTEDNIVAGSRGSGGPVW